MNGAPAKKKWFFISNLLFIAGLFYILVLAIQYLDSHIDQETSPEKILANARRLRDNSAFPLSREKYDELIIKFPDYANGYIEYAQLLLENGFFDEATDMLKQFDKNCSLSQLPDSIQSAYHWLKGKIQDEQGEGNTAIDFYWRAYEADKESIRNAVSLLVAIIQSPDPSGFEDERIRVTEQLERLANNKRDGTAVIFVNAYDEYVKKNYLSAYNKFLECRESRDNYIVNCTYQYLMELVSHIEKTPLDGLNLQRELYEYIENSENVKYLKLLVQENYGLSLYRYATDLPVTDETEKAKYMNDALEILKPLYKQSANPNVYICYSNIMRNQRQFRISLSILKGANSIIEDNVLILINQIYAEYDYRISRNNNDFSELKRLFNKVEKLYDEKLLYTSEMLELLSFKEELQQAGEL